MNDRGISVVIPTRDRTELVTQCLKHLAADPMAADLQVVVADDSRQGSLHISIPSELGEVLVVRSGGRGHGAARNCGWRASSAPIVVFLDDDIRPLQGTLEKLTRSVAAGEADWMQANVLLRTGGNPVVELIASGRNYVPAQEGTGNGRPSFVATACLATRRECLEEVGGFNEKLPRLVDHEMGLRARRRGHRIRFLPDAVAEDLDPRATSVGAARRIEVSSRCNVRVTLSFLDVVDIEETVLARCAVPFYRKGDLKSALRQIAQQVFSLPLLYPLLLRATTLAERRDWKHYPVLGKLLFCAAAYRGFRLGFRDISPGERITLRKWFRKSLCIAEN